MMLFKNAIIYQIKEMPAIFDGALIDVDGFEQDLFYHREFVPCTGIRPQSYGWVPPFDGAESLLHGDVRESAALLTARHDQKVIPPSMVNMMLVDRVSRLEKLEGRKVRAKEKRSIKENVMAELLPNALVKTKITQGLLFEHQGNNYLVIGTGSPNEAERFINCIRDTLGSFVVTPLQVKQKPTDVFTRWLTHRQLPDGLAFGAECDFLDIEEAAKVTCRNQDLETQEVRNHLESGKVCTMVGLIANGLRFSIDRQLTLRRLKLMDVIERPDDEADDPRSKLDYEIWETRTQLCQAIQALVPALGGFASEN